MRSRAYELIRSLLRNEYEFDTVLSYNCLLYTSSRIKPLKTY